jgi:hypothetical protein
MSKARVRVYVEFAFGDRFNEIDYRQSVVQKEDNRGTVRASSTPA